MADYYEVSSVREDRDGKKRWTRLGVAFPHRQGDGFNVQLAAIPAPEDGEYKLILTRPKPKDEQQQRGNSRTQQASGGNFGGGFDDDSDAPF